MKSDSAVNTFEWSGTWNHSFSQALILANQVRRTYDLHVIIEPG